MIQYNRKHYSNEVIAGLYKAIIKPRMIEEKMLILLRQGKVSKWFSGIGQEAISIGTVMALKKDEYILPLLLYLLTRFSLRNFMMVILSEDQQE